MNEQLLGIYCTHCPQDYLEVDDCNGLLGITSRGAAGEAVILSAEDEAKLLALLIERAGLCLECGKLDEKCSCACDICGRRHMDCVCEPCKL